MNACARAAAALRCGALSLLLLAGAADAAAFPLADLQGRTHTLAEHQGRWVLVNLWATWCPPCLAEMPELEALSRARRELVVLGVATDGVAPQRLLRLVEKLRITYPIVAGDEALAQRFGAKVYPTSLLYDRTGKQVMFKEGPIKRQEIEALIDRERS